ncbi:MAG: type II secretion system F family protein [archaeon]
MDKHKSKDKTEFLEKVEREILGIYKHKFTVLLATLPVPVLLALAAYLLGSTSTTVVAVLSLGLVFVLVPYSLISFLEFREIKAAEDSFPAFLRDIAQSVAAGMTIPQAVATASQTNYGVLSKYVQKLNAMLSWSMPFPDAWARFTTTLKRSSMISRINAVVLESFYAGGEIGTVLSSLATDVNMLKRMESDKKSMMQEHVAVMYFVFFIFLGIIIGLHKILVPILYVQKLGVFGGLALRPAEVITVEYFKSLFFVMTLIQAVSIGAIAGQIAEERIIAGLKHVVIMVAVGMVAFFIFVFPSTMTLDAEVFPSTPAIGQHISISGSVTFDAQPASGAQVQIMLSDNTAQSVFTDGLGQFDTIITAPTQPGQYTIMISVTYSGETKVLSKAIAVGMA